MDVLNLKNGSQEPQPIVVTTMMSLESLLEKKPIVFYELVMKCRDANHDFFGNAAQDLKALALLGEDGRVHDSIRNIVLSAVIGEDLDMSLSSPIAQ